MRKQFNNTWLLLTTKEKNRFVSLVASGIIISVADIVFLAGLLWIINYYVQPGSAITAWLPDWLEKKDSPALIAVFVLLFSLKNMAALAINRLYYTFAAGVAVRISQNRLQQYQQGPFDEFVNTDSSVLIRKLALQPFEFTQHILSGWQQVITQVFLVSLAVTAITLFNPILFWLLLLILVPPAVLVFFHTRKKMVAVKKHLRENNERSYQYLLDALKGYVEGNVYQRNNFFLQRFLQQRRFFSHYLFRSLSLQHVPGRTVEIFAVLGLFILIALARWMGYADQQSLLTIGAFMAAAYKIIPGVVKLINLAGQIKAYEYCMEELAPPVDGSSSENTETAQPIDSVSFSQVSFHYPGRKGLKDISFDLHRGHILGICGASGKGKTTLLNLLLGFLEPSSGKIVFNQEQVHSATIKKYRASIAYCRQQPFFIYDSILKNITLQEEGYDAVTLERCMQISGLDAVIEELPAGLQTIITENGKNISGGQQQRIMLARALYKDADLLLLDEPFNELDDASVETILEKLRVYAWKKIIILVTHDKQSLTCCNKILSLNEREPQLSDPAPARVSER